MCLIMARKILESPFQMKARSMQRSRSARSRTSRTSVSSFSSSRMGMEGCAARILALSSKGLISSMRMVRITMSYSPWARSFSASSPKETLVMRGAEERLSW